MGVEGSPVQVRPARPVRVKDGAIRIFDIGAKDGPQQVSDRILTIPNLLSFARLAALPFVYWDLVNGNIWRATIVAFIFGMTDWFDGYLARRLDQMSNLGKLLDPISDRAFFLVIGIGMVVGDVVSVWPVAIMLGRDLLVSVAGLYLLAKGRQPPDVTRLGKAATFGLMWAMGFWLLASAIGEIGDPNAGLVIAAWVTWSINIVLSYGSAVGYARTILLPASDDLPTVDPASEDADPASDEPRPLG